MKKKEKFFGRRGLFQKYKIRNKLHSAFINGANTEAATCPIEVEEIIYEGNFHECQLFNFDETGLYIQKMPTWTFLTSDHVWMGEKKPKIGCQFY